MPGMRHPAIGAVITVAAIVVLNTTDRHLVMAAAELAIIAAFFGLGTYEWIRYRFHGPRRDQP